MDDAKMQGIVTQARSMLPVSEAERHKERVRATYAAAEKIAGSLPDPIRAAFEAWMAADLGVESMSERNRETVRTAIKLTQACGRAGIDMPAVLEELDHRAESLRDIQGAAESIVDDITAYPSRWPGVR
jgi:uncharacterized protein YdiU (UPF0061 family)